MKKLFLLLVVAVLFGGIIDTTLLAGDYIIYKASFKVNRFAQDPASKEWVYEKKTDQLRFGGYFIFKSDYTTDKDNYPARVITYRPKGEKFLPATYDQASNRWIAISGVKQTNKLLIYPYDVNWQNGDVTSLKENYAGTTVDKIYLFGGSWDTVSIKKSTFRKHMLILSDFYSNDKAKLLYEHPELFKSKESKSMDLASFIGYSEVYSGFINNSEIAPSLGGNLSIDFTDVFYKSKQITLRYNKAISRNALTGSEKTMREAVNSLVKYLTKKGYASTWVD